MVGAMSLQSVREDVMTKNQEMQGLMRLYREQAGQQSVSMHDVAKFAVSKGWPLPKPKSALDRLAAQFSAAAREEVRRDEVSGRPYRANLAVVEWHGNQQLTLWTDIDEAPRHVAQKAFVQRREQMVGDAVQLTFDVMHWNRVNEGEDPIVMPMDFEPDVQWRINAPGDDEKAA